MHAIRIDRTKPLAAEPHSGHNRYHPDIAPVLEVAEGDEVVLETRDCASTDRSARTPPSPIWRNLDAGRIHPLTGPVFVKGAEPGDMIEVEFLDIVPQPTAFSSIVPGLGFLRDVMTTPFVVHWKISDGWATAAEIPGVRIPGAPFMGISGTAPSAQKLKEWTDREQRALDAGGFVMPPSEAGAVPSGRCGLEGLRTLPPRENGGNFDVKQLTKGAKLLLPVFTKGALFSTGDGAFRARRRRSLRHRRRDGRNRRGPLQDPQGSCQEANLRRPRSSRISGYFADPKIRGAGEFPRRHGHADQCQGRNRKRKSDARLPATRSST